MKRKLLAGMCLLLAAVLLGAFAYVGIGKNSLERSMWDYLKQEHYRETDIQSLEVKHSFMNIPLSYDEWSIDVVYADEPASVYVYTLEDRGIVLSAVSGTTDKEDLKHLTN